MPEIRKENKGPEALSNPEPDELDLTIAVPVLNEEKNIPELYSKIKSVIEKNKYRAEILFVDDGSTDGTLEVLKELHKSDPNVVKTISFTRNFGKSAAYVAAFRNAKGKVVVTMDGDCQDDPEEIPVFLEKLNEGYDLVTGWKYEGKGKASRAIPSKFFNRVTARMTRIDIHDFNCPFKAYRRSILPHLHIQGELYRYIPVLAISKGFKVAEVKSKLFPRKHGETKYGIERFLRGFLDLITVLFLSRFTKRPLHFFGGLGVLSSGLGALILGFLFFMAILRELYVQQIFTLFRVSSSWNIHPRPLLDLSLLTILLGFQLMSLGLIAELLAMRSVRDGGEELYVVRQTLD